MMFYSVHTVAQVLKNKTHNKCMKNIRLSLIGTFKSGAPHALLKAPYANR